MRRLGFYRGDVTGTWDEETEKAFREWAGYENFENKIRNDDNMGLGVSLPKGAI